jgi:hypothetical protein
LAGSALFLLFLQIAGVRFSAKIGLGWREAGVRIGLPAKAQAKAGREVAPASVAIATLPKHHAGDGRG